MSFSLWISIQKLTTFIASVSSSSFWSNQRRIFLRIGIAKHIWHPCVWSNPSASLSDIRWGYSLVDYTLQELVEILAHLNSIISHCVPSLVSNEDIWIVPLECVLAHKGDASTMLYQQRLFSTVSKDRRRRRKSKLERSANCGRSCWKRPDLFWRVLQIQESSLEVILEAIDQFDQKSGSTLEEISFTVGDESRGFDRIAESILKSSETLLAINVSRVSFKFPKALLDALLLGLPNLIDFRATFQEQSSKVRLLSPTR